MIKEKLKCIAEDFKEYFRSEGFDINDEHISLVDGAIIASYGDIKISLDKGRDPYQKALCLLDLTIKIGTVMKKYNIAIKQDKDEPLLSADSLVLSVTTNEGRSLPVPTFDFKEVLDDLMNERF